MAIIKKGIKYDEFTIENGIHCIGGKEIFHIWHDLATGWTWYATKIVTYRKIVSIYEGYVEGDFNEFGSWYPSDVKRDFIEEMPKANWNNVAKFATS